MYPAAGKAPLLRIEACSRWAAEPGEQGATATSSVAAQIRQSPGCMRSTVHHSGASPSPSGSKDQSASAAGGGIVLWCEQETSPRAGDESPTAQKTRSPRQTRHWRWLS